MSTIDTRWRIEEYCEALGFYVPREPVDRRRDEPLDWVLPAEYDEGSECTNPRYSINPYATLADTSAIAKALGTHELIEWSEVTDVYGSLEYVQVVNAWTGRQIARMYCTSHERLDPLIAKEK